MLSCNTDDKEEELLDYSGKMTMYNRSLGGVIDSIQIIDGKGFYDSDMDEGLVINTTAIEVDQHYAHYMIMEKGRIEVKILKDSSIVFGGTPNNIATGVLERKIEPKRLAIHKLQSKSYAGLDSLQTLAAKEADLVEIRKIAKESEKLQRDFALSNRNIAGLVYVRKKMSTFDIEELALLKENYSKHKEHPVYQSLERYYDASVRTQIGAPAPEYSIPNTNDEARSLADHNGKVVLLDFWASWCVPCRKAIPHLKELDETYKDNGLEIVSISIDDDKEKWLKAVEEEQMPWSQLLDHKDEVSKEYYINSVPKMYIIDRSGNIVAKNIRGEALDEKLGEIFSD